MHTNTIAAIATPTGNAGVGIIRLSGPQSLDIISKCFNHNSNTLTPRYATYGTLATPSVTDSVIVIYFPNPNSFTGEDVIEIHAHGGYFLLEKILEHLITLGATLASPGEFSKRAFLNGKLSLDQCEAIIETIHAESETHLNATNRIYQGRLREKLFAMEKKLIECTAQIIATLDYPEHDIEDATSKQISQTLREICKKLEELIQTSCEGRLISSGIQIAVLGKPNVGKSSLFNAILERDRSIVTDIQGTTTDTISESILFKGMKLVFNDTAGIRDTEYRKRSCEQINGASVINYGNLHNEISEIEKLGIRRTEKVIANADIVLAIFDSSTPPTDEDKRILELTRNKTTLFILNKSDLVTDKGQSKIWFDFIGKGSFIQTSAITGQNITKIKQIIHEMVIDETLGGKKLLSSEIVITNTRHVNELTLGYQSLTKALKMLPILTLDCISIDIETALNHIGNITGTRASDAVIDEIFSRFCIGK
ncbi:MAG: tRNA uridine-5-carboxymethylaminomethyl(34) synthesis GTPase MnmE [Firmicutes bacterium]|nr:tRNA uridine-5-carboxymethylaminomethyl(34) synthesis GTPase MnmE [Bacillota bacterium]